jgi:hypothetical protein
MVVEAIQRISEILDQHLNIQLTAIGRAEELDIDPDLTIEFSQAAPEDVQGVRLSRKPVELSDQEFDLLKDFVGSFLEGFVGGVHKLADLEQVSSHLERLVTREDGESSGNVVNISRYRPNRFPLTWGKVAGDDGADNDIHARLFVGPSPEMNFRAALDLHAESGRYAFVNVADLNPNVWEDVVSVRRLGNLTIFVTEITQLSMLEQDNMLAILLGAASDQDPCFVFASRLNVSELRRSGMLHPDLLDLLEPTHQRIGAKTSSSSQTDQFLSP